MSAQATDEIDGKEHGTLLKKSKLKLTDEHEAENRLLAKMVGLFAPEIFGLAKIKKALILSAISTSMVVGFKNPRLNVLLIGLPGLAKSALLKAIVKIVYGSKFADGIHSTGRTLTAVAIQEKNNADHITRRLNCNS